MFKLGVCVAGIYTCFLTWGYFQEKVSTTPYGQDASKFNFFIFLNMVQAITASAVAFLFLKLQTYSSTLSSSSSSLSASLSGYKDKEKKPSTPPRSLTMPSRMLLGQYFRVALLNAIASPFSYAALKHIDYPTMILTKSCKLIPVMIMNILLYRRSFPTYKYVCVALITLGVSGFMLLAPFDEHKSSKHGGSGGSSFYGMLLVLINLTIDGVTNSTQDQIFTTYKVTGQEMMCFMNLFMSGFMATWLINPFNSELGLALAFCRSHPAILKDIALFSICGAVGQCFIFYTLEQFGSLSLVTVTVTRKLFTILLSVFAYGHPLNPSQWIMVGVVFSGIGLEAYVKRNEKLEKMGAHLPKHSPKLDQISFASSLPANGPVEMMKKDKLDHLNATGFVGFSRGDPHLLGAGLVTPPSDPYAGHQNFNSNNVYGLDYNHTSATNPSPPPPPPHGDNYPYPYRQQQSPSPSSAYIPQVDQLGSIPSFSAKASYVSSRTTQPGMPSNANAGRQRTSMVAPKRQ